MLKVNGKAYDWGDVDLKIPGLNIQVQEISYDDELEIEEVFVTTCEATLAADGLLHDLDGLVDRQPSIFLFIDAAVDEGARLRNGRDELVESAPAHETLRKFEVHWGRLLRCLNPPNHLNQGVESGASVPRDEYFSSHYLINFLNKAL